MARWQRIEDEFAEFAAKVRARFDAETNKTIATVRRAGAPRITSSSSRGTRPTTRYRRRSRK